MGRLEGASIGRQLSADHHPNVPGRMQVTDPHNGRRFAPIEGAHTVMNERQQYLSHLFTSTVNNSEREPVARDLKRRFEERDIPIDGVTVYLDKCGDDMKCVVAVF